MKYLGYTYEKAHNIANKIENIYREKVKNGANINIDDAIFKAFVKKYTKKELDENLSEGQNICHPISITPEIKDYLMKFDSDEKLLRSGGIPINLLDDAAFGFNVDTLKQISPKDLSIKWKDDLENVLYEIQKSGLSKVDWAKRINLSEPIDVSYNGKKFYIEDGHHRYYAAKILGKPLNINLEIKANPIIKLGGDLGYDDFHRCVWKQVHNQKDDNMLKEEDQKPISKTWVNKLWSFLSPQNRNNSLHKKWYNGVMNGTISDNELKHFKYLLKNGNSMYKDNKLTTKN
jgi:hypothetical protein